MPVPYFTSHKVLRVTACTCLRKGCGFFQGMDTAKILCYTIVSKEKGEMAVELLEELSRDRWLTTGDYARLLDRPHREAARRLADRVRREQFGTRVFLRGLIDVGSICRFDCPHCHQRASADCVRYRMRPREILDCCEEAEAMGVQSFLLRSGPDRFYTDRMLFSLISRIRGLLPHCAVTLAMGERDRRSMTQLSDAGADRYLLLQETADPERFRRTHPADLDFEKRLHCLNEMKEAGFQTGCGFLVGDLRPGELAKELKFLEEFQPHAVELVPMGAEPETVEYLISLIRLMLPEALITAPDNSPGQILAGANVVTQSLIRSRRSHPCCGGNRFDGPADPETLAALSRTLSELGYEMTLDPAPWNG